MSVRAVFEHHAVHVEFEREPEVDDEEKCNTQKLFNDYWKGVICIKKKEKKPAYNADFGVNKTFFLLKSSTWFTNPPS